MKIIKRNVKCFLSSLLFLFVITGCVSGTPTRVETRIPQPTYPVGTHSPSNLNLKFVSILLDDFNPQSYHGETEYYFNRLGGDRGVINQSILDLGNGQLKTIISPENSWGGVWMSLN
ncbi:MAG: hypothetical protein ACW98K_15110, partial [Candidatus Kariarchaeaceae archaeon]